MSDMKDSIEVREISAAKLGRISGGTGSSETAKKGDIITDFRCSCGNMEMRAVEVTDDYVIFECTACHKKIKAVPSRPAIHLNKDV